MSLVFLTVLQTFQNVESVLLSGGDLRPPCLLTVLTKSRKVEPDFIPCPPRPDTSHSGVPFWVDIITYNLRPGHDIVHPESTKFAKNPYPNQNDGLAGLRRSWTCQSVVTCRNPAVQFDLSIIATAPINTLYDVNVIAPAMKRM